MAAKKRAPVKPQPKPKPAPAAPPTLSEVAQRLGLSVKALAGHFERNEIPESAYRWDQGRRVIVDTAAVIQAVQSARERAPERKPDAEEPELPEGLNMDDPTTWPLDLRIFEMVREYWCARQTKLKTELASGELVRASEVRNDAFKAMRTARDHLLAIPDQVGDDVAAHFGAKDATDCKRVIRERIDRVLADLSRALKAEDA